MDIPNFIYILLNNKNLVTMSGTVNKKGQFPFHLQLLVLSLRINRGWFWPETRNDCPLEAQCAPNMFCS